jgi:hypothetical protein
MAAAEGEEVRCAVAQERLGDEPTAVDLGHAALIPRAARWMISGKSPSGVERTDLRLDPARGVA